MRWATSTRLALVVLCGSAIWLLPTFLRGQQVEVIPRLSLGEGSTMTGLVAARVQLVWEGVGVWGTVGKKALSGECSASIPPHCSVPESRATEVSAGVTALFAQPRLYVSAGGGVLRWDGSSDPFLEAELGARISLNSTLGLRLGLRGQAVREVSRDRPDLRVAPTRLRFVEGVVGLAVGIGGS